MHKVIPTLRSPRVADIISSYERNGFWNDPAPLTLVCALQAFSEGLFPLPASEGFSFLMHDQLSFAGKLSHPMADCQAPAPPTSSVTFQLITAMPHFPRLPWTWPWGTLSLALCPAPVLLWADSRRRPGLVICMLSHLLIAGALHAPPILSSPHGLGLVNTESS